MSEYTPTTDEVRREYVSYLSMEPGEVFYGDAIAAGEADARFKRWLSRVEREAAARALDAEAEVLFMIIGNQRAIFQVPAATQMNRGIHLSAERLRARAAEIREENGEHE